MENVPESVSFGDMNIPEIVCRSLEDHGYEAFWTILNAADYGVPQLREARLIYDIQREEQFIRGQHKDELGVRIQKLGTYSNPTCDEACNNIMLEESVDGDGGIYMSVKLPKATQESFQRRHHVLIVMREEYAAFDQHLYTLMPEEQQIIIPLLKHTKDYTQLSEETGIAIETIRKRVSRIRKEFIEDMTEYFAESIKGGNQHE